ncbi:TRAP transporter small permease [Thioclava sp. F34-6]|uniref:TRAP transporter small permease subunit n=1 Tax=Thioclava sp. F34-6 TaxID=1973003 RepID=UPI00143B2F9E|nr:TRAP transporter small permease [Thioclava sp. F34-6]
MSDLGGFKYISVGSDYICRFIIIAMTLLIAYESIARSLFDYSLGISNEVGGYLVVALTFLSLPYGYAEDVYTKVEFLDRAMGPRTKLVLAWVFKVLCLLLAAVLTWQFWRFSMQSIRTGETSMTPLMTPLWIPRLVMLVGSAALALTILASIIAPLFRSSTSNAATVKKG